MARYRPNVCQGPINDMILINYHERCHSGKAGKHRHAFRKREKQCDSPFSVCALFPLSGSVCKAN